MTTTRFNDMPGTLADAATLRIQRRLPGPIERVWSFLIDGELRRQWLASGPMRLEEGSEFELVWRNDDLSASPRERPEGFSAESRATCRVLEVDAPRRLRYLWPGVGEVSFVLEAEGDAVVLTLTHRQPGDGTFNVNVQAGWHAHLALLVACLEGTRPPSLWSLFKTLRASYAEQASAT